MKIITKTNRKPLAIIVLVGLGLVVAYLLTAWALQLYPFGTNISQVQTDVDYGPPTQQQIEAGQDAKQSALERSAGPSSDPDPETSGTAYAAITSATYDPASKQAVVQTKLDNTVSWKDCNLTVTKDTVKVTKQSSVIYQGDYSICEGFAVAGSELSSGAWSVILSATSNTGRVYETNSRFTIP